MTIPVPNTHTHTHTKKERERERPIPLACVNENAYDGKLRSISLQSFSPEVQARHSVLKQLDLNRVAEWSQEKRKCLT